MKNLENLRKEIDGEEETFLIILRTELRWDWDAFNRLTNLMYDVADGATGLESVDKHIAQGYWFIDTWVRDWTGHDDFPRPEKDKYEEAIQLLRDLSYFFFTGVSPYEDDGLKKMVEKMHNKRMQSDAAEPRR